MPFKGPIDYSLYLVTGREVLPPGAVNTRSSSRIVYSLTINLQDYYESLEQVGQTPSDCLLV